MLYVSEPRVALFLVKAANFYVTDSSKAAFFHGQSFYSAARAALGVLHDLSQLCRLHVHDNHVIYDCYVAQSKMRVALSNTYVPEE